MSIILASPTGAPADGNSLSIHLPVVAATTSSGNLATDFNHGSVLDGITLSTGDRILIKDQINIADNGIYVVELLGVPTRSSDLDSWGEVENTFVLVDQGILNAQTGWQANGVANGTIGVDDINFAIFSSAVVYSAGVGLELNGSEFSLITPLPINLGGTGTTTLGLGNQFLSMNAAGTGVEYKSILGGDGISAIFAGGTLTIGNDGILSVAGVANEIDVVNVGGHVTLSLPPVISVSGINLPGLTSNSMTFINSAGNLTSTAAPLNGELLIGNSGLDPILNTITAGTGISIANGAGTITINNTNPAVIPLGSSNQILSVDVAGTGAEYRTISVGGGLSVAFGANSIAFNNTGILTATGTPNEIDIIEVGGNITLSLPPVISVAGINLPSLTSGSMTFIDGNGDIASTAAALNGQVLIGRTGLDPVLNTITAGANITITNLPGSILIESTAATFTAGTGLDLTGNTFSLISPVSVALGGTGQTTLGSGDEFLSMNAAGTGTEYKQIFGGNGITATSGIGTLILDNTGVLSISGTLNEIDAVDINGNVTLSLPPSLVINGLTLSGLTPNSMMFVGLAGNIVSTASPLDGEILIGRSGLSPVLNTITAGTNITITNTAGNITIGSTVPIFTAGTGLTLTGSTFSLTSPVSVALGGTGQTTLGGSDEFLSMDATGTGTEYKQIIGGNGITATVGVGSLTLENDGILSISGTPNEIDIINIGGNVTLSLPPTISVAGINLSGLTPSSMIFVDSAGNMNSSAAPQDGEILIGSNGLDPVLNTITGGTNITVTNTAGNITIDGASGSSILQLYEESSSAAPFPAPVTTAINAVAIGEGALGHTDGMKAFANGSFVKSGDAQLGVYVARGTVAGNTRTEIFLDGISKQLIIPNNSAVAFTALFSAKEFGGNQHYAGFKIEGVAHKGSTANSIIVSSGGRTTFFRTKVKMEPKIDEDFLTGSLRIRVKSDNVNLQWVATITTSETVI